jgi:hypothetical protein
MEVKMIGQMDNTIDHTFESANRVYDKNGLSPTINTCGGGGLQPKILEDAQAIRMVRTEEGKALRKEYESGAIHHGFNEHREMELRTDGVSNTFYIIPTALGHTRVDQVNNLVSILDGYFKQKAHHLNVNVLNRDLLIDAMNNPYKYPTLTIRVSGYAVNFNKLSEDHKKDVIARTFHESF